MIRIIIPLILAVAAFFGPWVNDGQMSVTGADYAQATVDCFIDLNLSVTGACAPQGSLGEQLIGYTVLFGAAAAVLSILGLLPLIGRLTSIIVIAAGLTALGAVAMTVTSVMGGVGIAGVGWGAWASLAAALVAIVVGIGGVRGEGGSDY